MWPETIIEQIELVNWDTYQIDIKQENKHLWRIFLKQSELLKMLSEANQRVEYKKQLKQHINDYKDCLDWKIGMRVEIEWREIWKEEMKKVLYDMEQELMDL